MKILRFLASTSLKSGGPQNGIKSLSPYLEKNNISTNIISLDENLEEIKGVEKIFSFKRYTKYNFNLKALFSILTMSKLYKSCDLIIIHGHWQFHVLLGLLVSLFYKKPYLVMPHGMLDPWFARELNISKIIKKSIWILYEYMLLKNAKFICFTSKEELRKSFFTYNSQLNNNIIIPYGISNNKRNTFKNITKKKETHFLRIIYIGRFHKKKNLEALLLALKDCLKKAIPVKLTLVGEDNSKYSKRILELIKNLSINENIEVIKFITDNRKMNFYNENDFSIVASFQENFCISAIESISMGVPVIISNQCDLSSELKNKKISINISTDVKSISSGIVQAYDMKKDKKNFLEMRKRCIKVFNDSYSYKKITPKIIEIYKSSIKQ